MADMMRAMVMQARGEALSEQQIDRPVPDAEQILIKVRACAVCRTDLHVVDGDLSAPKLPLVPGHEVIGIVVGMGSSVKSFQKGDRVGVPWLGWTCGKCEYCTNGQENLCEKALFTGYTLDGGFAEYMVADQRYCFPVPVAYSDIEAAPLMCAGLIGYRAYRMVEEARHIGLYGFGAAAHIMTQVAVADHRHIYAFTKNGDTKAQDFARSLGADWAGNSDSKPSHPLDAAIIFAPVGSLIPLALQAVRKAGIVVCAGIHMSEIPSFSYDLLWEERMVRSVANLTREDGTEFLRVAPKANVQTKTIPYPLTGANEALEDLRQGRFEGAAVLVMD